MFNRVAPGEARAEIDGAHKSKVDRIEHLVRRRVVQYCLGVDTRAMRECAWGGYRHIEGNGEIEAPCYKLIEWCQLCQIAGCEQFWVMDVELGDQAAERGNTIALSYSHHCDIQAISSGL